MEEVIGSIPIRSTNIPFSNYYLPTVARHVLWFRGCGRVLKFFHLKRQHQLHDFRACFALLSVNRAGVDIKRRATAGMTQ